jgi:hypothetical protein
MNFRVAGVNTVNPANHHMSATVTITGTGLSIPPVAVDPMDGPMDVHKQQHPEPAGKHHCDIGAGWYGKCYNSDLSDSGFAAGSATSSCPPAGEYQGRRPL